MFVTLYHSLDHQGTYHLSPTHYNTKNEKYGLNAIYASMLIIVGQMRSYKGNGGKFKNW